MNALPKHVTFWKLIKNAFMFVYEHRGGKEDLREPRAPDRIFACSKVLLMHVWLYVCKCVCVFMCVCTENLVKVSFFERDLNL